MYVIYTSLVVSLVTGSVVLLLLLVLIVYILYLICHSCPCLNIVMNLFMPHSIQLHWKVSLNEQANVGEI